MTTKRKHSLSSKDLPWKSVDVNSLGDFEGFYGLEEVDGVGVDIIDGEVRYHQKDKSSKTTKTDESEISEKKSVKKLKSEKKSITVSSKKSKEETADKSVETPKITKKRKLHNEKKTELVQKNAFDVLEDLQDDNSPLIDWKFDDGKSYLSLEIRRALTKLKFENPTEIQRLAIPVILSGKDVIGKAATGSGKTLAYGIPILEKHMNLLQNAEKVRKWPTALIFSPTRELAHQITHHLEAMSKFCNLGGPGIMSITGGLSVQKQQRMLSSNPAVVVATPGRFLDILKDAGADLVEFFRKVEILVLDEADRLIQEGHFKELESILALINGNKKMRHERQTLVFSATFQLDLFSKLAHKKQSGKRLANNEETVRILQQKLRFKDKNPTVIDSNPAESVAKSIVESIMECGATEKDLYLYYFLLTYTGKSIVFVNSVDVVKRLGPFLRELKLNSFLLHSDMIQKQRLRSLEKFAAAENGILVATDVAARGLDIAQVQHVIHYHLPRTADMYVHRSGRTARAGEEGISLILCSPEESSGPLVKLKRVLQHNQPLKTFEVDYDILNRLKSRVSLAKKVADATLDSARKGKNDAWFKEAADDLGLDDDDLEEIERSSGDKKKKNNAVTKQDLKVLRAELQQELAKPVGHGGKYLTHGRNLAQMLVSQSGHEKILGKDKKTALQTLKGIKGGVSS